MNTLTVIIEGAPCEVPVGTSIAAAMARAGCDITRRSVCGEPRAPFCGMGICQECRVTVNGCRVLACQTDCQPGMVIERSHYANL